MNHNYHIRRPTPHNIGNTRNLKECVHSLTEAGNPSINNSEISNSKAPQVAINGFIAWLLFIVFTVMYLVWAIVPDRVLHQLHITYYPDKYWAVAVPAMLVIFFSYYFTTHAFLVLMMTYPLDDGHVITDVDAKTDTQVNVAVLAEQTGSVPMWVYIPVSISSRLLFQPWKEK
ncbi:unnamed protein product [Phytomonas sp. EM1]|nr:unnamed protein product [Phytomonas sp. EM1]|eukprot:CCW63868.1 unnamed protein product [Phytomonas sp. isolate EM1]